MHMCMNVSKSTWKHLIEAKSNNNSHKDLKVMAVQMEWVSSVVPIVDNNLDNLILLQNEAMSIRSIDLRVRCLLAACQGSI